MLNEERPVKQVLLERFIRQMLTNYDMPLGRFKGGREEWLDNLFDDVENLRNIMNNEI